jgi:hypothetical protein
VPIASCIQTFILYLSSEFMWGQHCQPVVVPPPQGTRPVYMPPTE